MILDYVGEVKNGLCVFSIDNLDIGVKFPIANWNVVAVAGACKGNPQGLHGLPTTTFLRKRPECVVYPIFCHFLGRCRYSRAKYAILTAVTYALRKLIAFVFLGGMFWFIYQDLDNLNKPWFMHALGLITIAFAFFWLLIPMIVVKLRIRRRIKQNRVRYEKWLADGGVALIHPRPAQKARLNPVDPGEQSFFHEKGTLYVGLGAAGFDALERPVGRPSDVAFPGHRSKGYVCQRTHCSFTNRRIVFAGKDLDISIPLSNLKEATVNPGGMVFETTEAARYAFTFQNPLVAADMLARARA